jgi:hypothetical protein
MQKQAKKPGRRDFTPVAVRPTHNGWTPQKQVAFIDALAEMVCVKQACGHVGMSTSSAYALRIRPDAQGFRIAWDAALDFGARRLSDEAMSRAVHGEVVPHYYKGELVGEHRRYDNKLAMFLLRYRDPLRYAATLDQMVYSGHPEAAAMALMKARNRMMDEAWGVAAMPADDPNPTGMPYDRMILSEANEREAEQAIIEGTGPIHGTVERRERLHRARAHHVAGKRKAEEAARAAADRAAAEHAAAALDKVADTFARCIADATSDEEREELRRLEIEERSKLGDPAAIASFLSTLPAPPARADTAIARAIVPPRAARAAFAPRKRPPPTIRTP